MPAQSSASEWGHFIKGLGFRVYLAKARDYGFITDETGSRVLSFSFTDGGKLHGNYGPPSRASGTGWRLEQSPYDLHTAADVRRALYEHAPSWCGNGWSRYTTLEQHLKLYGDSSGFVEL